MIVVLDRQHRGKPSNTGDWGASADLDGDGKVEIHEREAYLTGPVSLAAESRLVEWGHAPIPMSDGTYAERHDRANRYRAGAYVALHFNAGGGDYGSVFADYRSARSLALAQAIADAIAETIEPLKGKAKVIKARPDDWTKNAFATIAGTQMAAVCFEPLFLDHPKHAPFLGPWGLDLIGTALADGIHAWSLQ